MLARKTLTAVEAASVEVGDKGKVRFLAGAIQFLLSATSNLVNGNLRGFLER
jgi:hypothetical protein